MPNQVTYRVFDFLKEIEPFSYLDQEALLRVAARVEVRYQPPGTVVFRPGEPPRDRFFVVKEGTIELYSEDQDGNELLIERCGEGEIFGIRPLLAEDNYVFLARAAEESLLYAVNSEGFRDLITNYPRVLEYLMTSMAGSSRYAVEYRASTSPARVDRRHSASSPDLQSLQSVQQSREPVVCGPDESIINAARTMTEHGVGSIVIVDTERRPVGIVTDRDLRRSVATAVVSRQAAVSTIMSKPVLCIAAGASIADIQIRMLRSGYHHLVLTEDGTDKSPVTGVVSEHDLLLAQGNSPAVLIQEISRARSSRYLRELRDRAERILAGYLEKQVAISHITAVMTQINDEIIRKCMKLALARMQADGHGNPPALFDWLALGSQGRGEQLLRTDQDNALIFEDVPEAKYNTVKAYFLKLADFVTEFLNDAGYQYCDGDMMASNPKWCLSVSKWKEQFSHWMHENTAENMLNTSIFFDYRGVWGDGSLPDKLTTHIFDEMASQSTRFQASLAQAALQNPSPLTFFRNFVVERSGEHKDQFDLKARAMRPLTDAARVLILQARKGNVNNTFRRYEALAEIEPQNADLYREAAEAYEVLIRLRADIGLKRGDSGRFIKPEELSQVQRLLLRNSFNPVKEIQQLLEIRFQLNFLR
ncbi:DUF294 nucleotidyltransferase-like domain-containing protein [Lewinella sp. JB7]|uniref:DUF294 nucleotidyltransferase-like domain-containing protein n=1 Tax=Lewinella sp. JB7 TaxID=2962887 RepID=UPI0020C99499|nr:DUF294 nucleotidyltransferase-like domain-containing protein [Lewinella sp. JB7]MCP9235022.1 DUF294 nucleotidyltransferase-like domain-containing protein [Lewinella sp. JB7]